MANLEHTALNSSQVHEPKHITSATTSDAGKVITPSGATSGVSVLRALQLDELDTAGFRSNNTGWAHYFDSTYTSGSPLALSAGVRTKVTIDGLGAGTDNSNVAIGDTDYWNTSTNKVTPTALNDVYAVTFRFKATTTASKPYFDLDFDIGGGVGVASSITEEVIKGSSAVNWFDESSNFHVNSTFLANGAEIFFNSSATINVYDMNIMIIKIHQAG